MRAASDPRASAAPRCPVIPAPGAVGREASADDALLPRAGVERAEAEVGPRDGALLVARAAALLRALRRDGSGLRFLPPPCRRLSAGEADLLAALRARIGGHRGPAAYDAPPGTRAALADLAAPISPPRGPVARPAVPPGAGPNVAASHPML